ncbi:capZ-interacting protein [Pseudochaenichthys georgianus]|uniref:capZ-interacting protein n=1 Tax=Pseudochaenichthys georgianus TaxID=52239 RepID=UPI00146D2EB4|nr:capZ-interacting protein [Pseudochaenichthys georgianus]
MEDSPSKPSVAELAGRFKGHILPMPGSKGELRFRRTPPCLLKLQKQKDDNEESDKAVISPNPFNVKTKNSSIIEKLQANLALSPTALLPSPKSPEVRLQPTPLSPIVPYSPLTSHLSSEEEDPISFDSPPEGIPLPNFNKTRARLSFKRRPPTRRHRRSTGEEIGVIGGAQSPCELYGPKVNGDHVVEHGQPASLNEAEEKDKDCEQTEDEVAQSDPDCMGHPEEEQEAEQTQNVEVMEEEEQPSEPSTSMQIEGEVEMEEMPQEEH